MLFYKELFLKSYLIELSSSVNYTPTASEIDELKNEILCFTMASHLLWTLWSFVNVHQDIEFGYWVFFIFYLFNNSATAHYYGMIYNILYYFSTVLREIESYSIFCCQRSIRKGQRVRLETHSYT